MKSHARGLLAVMFGAGLLTLAGCALQETSSAKVSRDDYARMETRAKAAQKADGNLGSDYVVDTLLNGSGKGKNTPVFDQPRGNVGAN